MLSGARLPNHALQRTSSSAPLSLTLARCHNGMVVRGNGKMEFMGSNLHNSMDKLRLMDKKMSYGKIITIGIWRCFLSYHIKGNLRDRIFFDDKNREKFFEILRRTKERYSYLLHAYALMENHYWRDSSVEKTPGNNSCRERYQRLR